MVISAHHLQSGESHIDQIAVRHTIPVGFSCRHGKLYGGVLTKPKIKRDSNHDENSRFALWSLGVTLKTARLPKDIKLIPLLKACSMSK